MVVWYLSLILVLINMLTRRNNLIPGRSARQIRSERVADAGDPERKLAMSMFAFSILYLFGLFAALILEHGFGLYFPLGGA